MEEKKSEESRYLSFFFIPPPLSPLHLSTCTSSSHRCPSKAASLLFLYPLHLGKITLWIGKGTLGPLTQASPFSPPLLPLPSFWIIDSCCLVIHRLHMPANSSGGGKLPSPATLRSTPNMHTTNHASRRALSHTCKHAAKPHTPQVWVKPRHIPTTTTTTGPWRARSREWEEGASGTLADEKAEMIDGAHCGFMNELYLPNTLSSADCQPVSILIWEKI